MITLKATRAACASLLSVRASLASLKAEESALTDVLRSALSADAWGPVSVGTDTVYVSESSERRGYDSAALVRLATTLGATPEALAACQTVTPVRGSVKSRKARSTDR